MLSVSLIRDVGIVITRLYNLTGTTGRSPNPILKVNNFPKRKSYRTSWHTILPLQNIRRSSIHSRSSAALSPARGAARFEMI
jgi:hypothetical protein